MIYNNTNLLITYSGFKNFFSVFVMTNQRVLLCECVCVCVCVCTGLSSLWRPNVPTRIKPNIFDVVGTTSQ